MTDIIGKNCDCKELKLCFQKFLADKSKGVRGSRAYRPNADKKFESYLSKTPKWNNNNGCLGLTFKFSRNIEFEVTMKLEEFDQVS